MVRTWASLALSLVYSLCVSAEVTTPEQGAQRLWIHQKSEWNTRQASLRVSFAPEHALPGTVTLECQVAAADAFDETHLKLTILDPRGNPIHTGEVRLDLSKKVSPAAFVWRPEGLADGEYSAQFALHRRTGGELGELQLGLSVITAANVHATIDAAKAEADAIRVALDSLAAGGVRPAYATLHNAIVEDYLPHAASALAAGDWPRAQQFATYLADLAMIARLELSLITPRTAATWGNDARERVTISPKVGTLVSGGSPVFLFGASHRDIGPDTLGLLERYGLDLAVYSVSPSDTLADAQRLQAFPAPMGAFLDEAERRGIRVVLDLAPERLPSWARSPELDAPGTGTFDYDLMADESRALLARHVRAAVGAAKNHPNALSVSLARDPALRLRESTLREGLIALAQSRYREYDLMNRRWRTRYMGFDEVEVDWNSRHSSYLYDLQTYHQELGTQFFAWLASVSREVAPELPVQVQFANTAFEKGESAYGIDRESILLSMDISGCSSMLYLDGDGLALGPAQQAACYALLRSLRPSAPVINTDDRFTLPERVTGEAAYGRVRAMMWEAVISGLDASAIQLGTPGKGSDGILARPELIDAYATTNLDINRLAPIVAALQQEPARVRILWSGSSKMFAQGDPYVESALRAYEGCSSFGPHTLFISERECESNGLDGVEVLVIPKALALSNGAFHAIDRYIEAGGVTIRQGYPFPYDQQGISRTDTISVSKRTILLRREDSVRAYLDALDAAYALSGMQSPPRPVNDFDYPVDGVKSRFAVHERVPYLYLINLRNEPVRVKLYGSYVSGIDLVSGDRVEFPESIDPLTPMVIQLDQPATPEMLAQNDDNTSPTTVELAPVVDESASQTSKVRPAARHGR